MSRSLFKYLIAFSFGLLTLACAHHSERADDKESIRSVVQANFRSLQRCYETALDQKPMLKGAVRAQWTILASGSVKDVAILKSSLNEPELERCLTEAIGKWQFPAKDDASADEEGTTVIYPFSFCESPVDKKDCVESLRHLGG